MEKFKTVDLFAGAGGLSLGFEQTNSFDIKVAFENNPYMQETYRRNHPGVDVRGDVCAADYSEIQNCCGKIDVVIGGPPCQGFSNANRQKSHAVSQNNMLVKQYIRAVRELQPKAFVMENVSMLRSDIHRFYLDDSDEKLIDQYDIPVTKSKLVLLDKAFMFTDALSIVQDPMAVIKELWPENKYAVLNVIYKACKNPQKLLSALTKHKKAIERFAAQSILIDNSDSVQTISAKAFSVLHAFYTGDLSADIIKESIEPAIMTQRMLMKAKEIYDNHLVVDKYDVEDGGLSAVIRSYAVFDYLKAILESEPNNYVINADVLCAADYGAPQKRMRFVVVGIKKSIVSKVMLPVKTIPESSYRTVRDAISDLERIPTVTSLAEDVGTPVPAVTTISSLGRILRDAECLYNHIITETGATALERFKAIKQGQNFHALDDSLKINTYTDISRTQNTIYLRLNYDQPSGTVINVRKSMWIHPIFDRAISVREAARLQTFPDSFVFCGSKDKQYQQVGNAVPPIMARAIAQKLAEQLNCDCGEEGSVTDG